MTKQWYDYNRSSFYFVQVLRNLKEPIVLKHTADFDQNGLFYWLGSNARWGEKEGELERKMVMTMYVCVLQEL